MSVCIDKLPHSCGTDSGLQVFADKETGKVDGFCFACPGGGKYIANPYGKPVTTDDVPVPEPKTEEEIKEELHHVSGYQTVSISARKLKAMSLEHFGTKVSVSEHDGKTPTAMYHPITKGGKITGYYVKTLKDKDNFTWSIGDVKDGDPFGWEQAKRSGAYRLIIAEGKEDAIAIQQLVDRYGKEDFRPAVIALPNGVNSVARSLGPKSEEITNLFREVVLCYDDDKAGHEAVQDTMLILPHALSVVLPEKDANECILKGCGAAAHKALSFNATKPKNTRLVIADEALHLSAREPTPFGPITWPYPSMNKLLRNIRYGELYFIGAGVKMGKSELLNDIAGHLIKVHGIPVFTAKPEEANKKTYKMLAGKMVGQVFHDPEVDFDYDAYDKAGEMLQGKLVMVNLYQHLGWESLKKDIVAAVNYGCKAIFIDPITNLTNGVNSGDANTLLQEISQELAAMALDLDIVIFVFCHLKAPEGQISKEVRNKKYEKGEYIKLGNCPHEFGGDIYSNQFAGSRAMMRSCHLMIGLEGNKDPELPENVRNLRYLTILEDREFGNAATVPLFWNKHTTFFKEVN